MARRHKGFASRFLPTRPRRPQRGFALQGQPLEERRVLAQVGVYYHGPDGNEDGENVKFYVTRTPDTTGDLTLYYTLSGTAGEGVDYPSQSGSVTIPTA